MSNTTAMKLKTLDEGLTQYLAAHLSRAKSQRKTILGKEFASDDERIQAISEAAREVLVTAFRFNQTEVESTPECYANIRKFLGNLFLPGGVFEEAKLRYVGHTQNELWFAPLLHLTVADPVGMAGVMEISTFKIAKMYLKQSHPVGRQACGMLEQELQILSDRVGNVDHKAFTYDVMRHFENFARGYSTLSDIADAGGLSAVTAWGADIDALSKNVLADVDDCKAGEAMFKEMVDVFFAMTDHLETTSTIPPEEAFSRKGLLLKAGLQARGRMKGKDDPRWDEQFARVVEYVGQPLTLRQSLCYLSFAPPGAGYDQVKADLCSRPIKEVMTAIETDYLPSHRSAIVRSLGLEKHMEPAQVFRMDASAFTRELGV